jgi:ribosome-associated translation inhibitor RaiA
MMRHEISFCFILLQDIIDVAYGPRKRQSRGERAGEKVDLSDMAVSSVWSTPVVEAERTETLADAWSRMKQNDISCLIIAEKRVPIGIITKKDLLEPIAQRSMESRQMTLQFSVKPDIKISEGARQAMLKDFDSFIRKYKKQLGLGKLFVYMKGHGSMKKGNQLIHCRLQFHTSAAQFYSKAEAWSAEEAFSLALDRLERRVIQSKEMKFDPKQRWKHFDRFMESEL